ncbi:hypothetical protein BU17DRAFT_79696 [Hysterangium stoloniferum]|nr:hypothetical protein BU17DRAFT_79696 [Hysterangium stoloniferum]
MDGLETPWTNTPPSKFNWDMIAGYEGTVYTPLTQSKEETTAVGTLHLLDNDAKHGHLQSTLQSTPHDSHCSARVQLSAHSDSSSPRLTPSPSPRANPSPLLYDASISSTGASGKGPGTYSARGSSIISPQLLTAVNTRSAAARPDFRRIESGGKASLVGDGRGRIQFEETGGISSSLMESSLPTSRTSSFITDPRSTPFFKNLHASSSFSKDHPIPISQATSVAMGNTTTKTNTEIDKARCQVS